MPSQQVEGAVADGVAVGLTDPILIGGRDDTSVLRSLQTDDEGRLITVSNITAEPASPTQGPATVTLTGGTNVVLVAAPGVGFSIVVPTVQIVIEDNNQTLTTILKEGTGGVARLRFTSKGADIYPPFVMNPPWKLTENTALVAQRTSGNKNVVINYHFFVEGV